MGTFVKVRNDEVPTIIQTLENHLPQSAMIYNVMKLKLSLGNASSDFEKVQIQMFLYKKDFQVNNASPTSLLMPSYQDDADQFLLTGLINVQGLPQNLVTVFCTNPNNLTEDMLQSFEKWMDWSKPNQFEGIENYMTDFLKEFCIRHGRVELHDPIEAFCMDKDRALECTKFLPETSDLKVEQLKPKDAMKINSVWPAACHGSLEMLTSSIELVGSAGVYINTGPKFIETIEGDEGWRLISWAVGLPFGSIHALHTEQKYQGLGYAKLTMLAVSKYIAESGRIPVVQIYKTNDTSKSVNLKVGFVYSHDINLIHYFPFDK